jgi:hypothetical protein
MCKNRSFIQSLFESRPLLWLSDLWARWSQSVFHSNNNCWLMIRGEHDMFPP